MSTPAIFALGLVLASAPVAPASPQGQVQTDVDAAVRALVGQTYDARSKQDDRPVPHVPCTSVGGSTLYLAGKVERDWSYGQLKCHGRVVFTMERRVPDKDRDLVWRIVDAIALPAEIKLETVARGSNVLTYLSAENCTLDGRRDTEVLVTGRWGKRKTIGWRTGVQAAWTFDIKRERIVPISAKRVVCSLSDV